MADVTESREEPAAASVLGLSEEWPEQAADAVVNAVDKVRNATTGPVVNLTRLSAYLVFGVFPLVIVLVLGTIATVRGLEVATGRAWAAHGICGLIFISLGTFAWSRRPS